MKLVFITPGMTFGGAERVISILANIWCDMGHDVSIFITATDRLPVYKLNDKINVENYADFNENGVSHFKLISSIRNFVTKERLFMEIRQAELAHMEVTGDFLFKYLCSIHKQLFQFEDLYRKLKRNTN